MTQTDPVAEIIDILETRATGRYGLADVNQQQHALQCAHLAEQNGESAAFVVAALTHDIGHLVHDIGEDYLDKGIDDMHEELGLRYLERNFGPDVTEPVALHVAAKRYLCATETDYFAKLSVDSVESLKLQGGPMSDAECRAFEAHTYWREAVRLRRLDEQGKDPAMVTPPVRHFEGALRQALAGASA